MRDDIGGGFKISSLYLTSGLTKSTRRISIKIVKKLPPIPNQVADLIV